MSELLVYIILVIVFIGIFYAKLKNKKNQDSEATIVMLSTSKKIDSIFNGIDVSSMTISSLSAEFGKSERSLMNLMMKEGIKCIDFDGPVKNIEKINKAKEKKLKEIFAIREKFLTERKDDIPQMTVAQIAKYLNETDMPDPERSVRGFLSRRNISCLDYIGSEEERRLIDMYGKLNGAIFCQHCQTKGTVRQQTGVKLIQKTVSDQFTARLVGIGGHITDKGSVTRLHCMNCNMNWDVS